MRIFSAPLSATQRVDLELIRHFFTDLFESELVSIRDRLATILGSLLSLLAAFGLMLPLMFNHKYHRLHALPDPALFREAALADKLMFICFSMVLTGLVTALEWQSLYPSRQDFLILGPLPLERIQLFRCKLIALLIFISILILGINVLPSLCLPGVMSGRWQVPSGSLLQVFSLFVACVAAGYFTCFTMVALQGLLLNLLPHRVFQRCSLYAQALLVLALLTSLPLVLWIPDLHGFMTAKLGVAFWLPPAWFLGLEEIILGTSDPFALALGKEAELASVAALLIALALYSLTYKRSTNHLLEIIKGRKISRCSAWAASALHLISSHPQEAAILSFITKTFFRSRVHKLLLAGIAGISFSLAVDSFLSLWIGRSMTHLAIREYDLKNAALSAPLVVSFFLLCGMRYLFSIPVEVRSNWLFQLSASSGAESAMKATEKALVLFGVLPVTCLNLLAILFWLGPAVALLHATFVMLMSLVLCEALLWNWDKIPFTCPYLPGKQNLIQVLLLYGLALSFFAYVATSVEMSSLLFHPRMYSLFGVLLFALAFLRFHRKRSAVPGMLLKFDDSPEPEVRTLQLQPE